MDTLQSDLEAEMAAMVVKYDKQMADQERDIKRLERDKRILQAVVEETVAELRELKAMLNGTLMAMRRRHDEGGISGL